MSARVTKRCTVGESATFPPPYQIGSLHLSKVSRGLLNVIALVFGPRRPSEALSNYSSSNLLGMMRVCSAVLSELAVVKTSQNMFSNVSRFGLYTPRRGNCVGLA
jgi:hypothetical protein